MFLPLIFLLLLSPLLVVCDDTQALRNAVKCLCEENTYGVFGSCCSLFSNGASLTLENTQFFVSSLGLDPSNQYITELFVFPFFTDVFFSSLHQIEFFKREITVLPSGCFSSLSSLTKMIVLLSLIFLSSSKAFY